MMNLTMMITESFPSSSPITTPIRLSSLHFKAMAAIWGGTTVMAVQNSATLAWLCCRGQRSVIAEVLQTAVRN